MAIQTKQSLHCRLLLAILLASFFVGGGCAKSLRTIDTARDSFASGNLALARQSLSELAEQRGRFKDSAQLDLAMVEMAEGDFDSAQLRLRTLRDHFDELPKVALAREAAAIVTDDTARVFRPAGYEQVMVRIMLALCSLATDQVDAESYSLQATMKQQELARDTEERGILDAKEAYQPIAIAPYIRGILRESTHHDYDDAARAYRLVSDVRPQFAPAQADIIRAVTVHQNQFSLAG